MIRHLFTFLYNAFFKLPFSFRYLLISVFNIFLNVVLFRALFFIFGNVFNYLYIFYFVGVLSLIVSVLSLRRFLLVNYYNSVILPYFKIWLAQIILLLISSGLLSVLVDLFFVDLIVAQLISVISAFFIGYFVYRFFFVIK